MTEPKQVDQASIESSPQFIIDGRPPVPSWEKFSTGCGGRTRLAALLDGDQGRARVGEIMTVCGWSRTVRKQGGGEFCFISLTDGSTPKTLQIIVQQSAVPEEIYAGLLKCGVCCSFKAVGKLVESPAKGQAVEMILDDKEKHSLVIYGTTDAATYPLSGKNISREKLREVAHLRARTFIVGCVTRIRSSMAMATHRFFQDRGFQYIHTPLITAADCEGAGELFQVTTAIPASDKISEIPKDKKVADKIDYKKDFFGKKAYLTVSGQLNLEGYACALCDVYTFSPAFRAENSHTSRHLAEFWMIEPEMAFADLSDNMRCAEAYLKYCVEWALQHNLSDLEWLDANVEQGLIGRLRNVVDHAFGKVTYTEAIEILEKEPADRFEEKPFWGMDLGSEHERFLAEQVYKKPVIVYNYPSEFKAFYMKQNDDGKTVRAMDVLLPKIGEVIGGSEREENLEKLDAMIKKKGLDIDGYWWYRDFRKYGTVPHSGFGLGFERLLMLISGVENIRDVIPYPRFPGTADF